MLNRLLCYVDAADQYSHRIRLLLAEKGIHAEFRTVKKDALPSVVAELNPYRSLPVLVDRELVLYDSRIIMEYLEERYPHPPLLPPYPFERAQLRLLMYRVQRDWCDRADEILNAQTKVDSGREALRSSLVEVAALFAEKPYFLSDNLTLVDCCLLPLLWRLPQLGIELPRSAHSLQAYMERHFARESFQVSLSDVERAMR